MCVYVFVEVCVPLLHNLQREVQQLSLALLSFLDHLQDGDGATQVPSKFEHLFIRCLVILTVL